MTDTTNTADLSAMFNEEEFLEHAGITADMSGDDILEHFGVKGMKWGKHTARPEGAKTRSELRSLDKASKLKDRADNDSAIDAARARVKSGATRQDLKDAKAAYKSDKQVIGKREAAKAYNAVKERSYADLAKSEEAKSGKEKVTAVLLTVGSAVVIAALQRA
jgi:hypothetical protein